MNPNPEEKSSNEPERLRAELQRQRQTLDAVMERLKAQEESTSAAWEVLAVLWRERQMAAIPKGKRQPDETVSEDENQNFFRELRLQMSLGRHDERIKEALARLQK